MQDDRPRSPQRWTATLALLVVVCLGACRPAAIDSVSEVIVYTSADDVYARAMAERFTQATQIRVLLVTDTEETKSSGLVNRLIAERSRPQADVFWSGDLGRAAILKQRGIAAPYQSPELPPHPPALLDPDHHISVFSARCRVLIYHRDLVPEGSRPSSLRDLVDPRFAGKACLANPLFGTTTMHAAALFEAWGDQAGRDFFKHLTRNRVRMLSSKGEVRRRVASGEFAIGLTDSDDVNVALNDGAPVGFVIPDQDNLGTMLIPSAAVLIAGGPHPEPGKRFIDFLLSPAGETLLAESTAAQIPLRPGLATPRLFPKPLSEIKLMTLDTEKLARRMDSLQTGFLREWVSDQNAR